MQIESKRQLIIVVFLLFLVSPSKILVLFFTWKIVGHVLFVASLAYVIAQKDENNDQKTEIKHLMALECLLRAKSACVCGSVPPWM
jgi:hypothetical protein